MGLIKKVFKSVKKVFKKVGSAFGKLMKNKFFKWVAIAGAIVFTAGAAAGAFGLAANGGLLGTLANSTLTKGIFAAGSQFGAGAANVVAGVGSGGASLAAAPATTAGVAVNTAPIAGIQGAAMAAPAGSALATMPSAMAGVAANAAPIASSGGGGLLGQLGGMAMKAGNAIASKPGAALLAGNIIQGATEPDPDELAKNEMRRRRQQDNRYGVNNYSGQQGLDLSQDLGALQDAGTAYTGGLLERVRAQGATLPNGAPIHAPGAYQQQYPTPPQAVDPNTNRG